MATEPTKLVIGDTVNWVRDYQTVNYLDKNQESITCPASSYTLSYDFRGPEGQISLIAVATGDNFEILAESTTTQKWVEGTYNWAAYVTYSTGGVTKRYEVDRGVIDLVANLAVAVQGYDGRSHIKRVLDGMEAIIEGRADKATIDMVSMAIAGRSISKDPHEFRLYYAQYKWMYKKEQAENNADKGNENPRLLIELP